MDIKKLKEWNPWWENNSLIQNLIGKKRQGYKFLLSSINIKEITIITGIRRSGKSTLMYIMIDNLLNNKVEPTQILFVNLEDKQLSDESLDDIYTCYRENINPDKKAYIFFDEIHKKQNWESWIRKKYDLKTQDKFVISGSCSYLLKKEYSTLLTGRNLSFEVFPLSFYEFLEFNGLTPNLSNIKKGLLLEKTQYSLIKHLKDYIQSGGFPEVVLKEEPFKNLLLKQYFDDILFKDIIDRHNLTTKKVEELALFFMTNFTALASLRNIRNSLNLSYDTTKDYLSYFKEAFLFFELNHFSYSFKEQKTLASKIYCIDNGLRNAVSFKFSEDFGKLAENLVFTELKRKNFEVYYWHNLKYEEVDFIVKKKDGRLIGINVTYTDDIDEREIKSLISFKMQFPKTSRLIIITKNLEKHEKGIEFIPLWKFLLLGLD